MEDKSTVSYSIALKAIKQTVLGWSPKGIVTDFEKPELRAINKVFPDVSWLQGCHFHYTQCLLRRFKKVKGFNLDVELNESLIKLKALPFLPVAAVIDAWKTLRTQLVDKWPAASNFAAYFEKTWVESNVYNLSLWNCYEQTLARRPRTNNVSEGGNNSIRIAFGVSNPII